MTSWLLDILGLRTVGINSDPAATQRGKLRLKAGAGVTLALVDDGADGETEVTIAASGGAGLSAPADPADNGKVAIASGGNLTYALLSNANIANGTIALAKMAAVAALSIVGNGTNVSAVPTALVGTDGQVPRVSGTTLAFGSLDLSLSATVGVSKLALANFADGSARSVLGRSANTGGVQASIAGGGANTVLVDNGTTLGFATLGLSSLSAVAALSVLGNGTNATASPAALAAATDGNIVRRSGTTVAFGSIDLSLAGAVGASKLAFANLADGSALSVLGRSAATSGAQASIAGTTDQVLRVDSAGTALGFGAINLASASAVTGLLPLANLANGSARSVLGRSANTSGVQASIAGAGANTVLVDNGTTLGFAAVPLGAIATIATDSLLGRDTAGTGTVEVLTVGGGVEFTGSGGIQRSALTGDVTASAGSGVTAIAAGVIVNADVNGAAAIDGTKILPDFGTQNIITTGTMRAGANPALSGIARYPNNSAIMARNAGNTADVTLALANASDVAVFGSSSFASQLLGSTVDIGDGTAYLEVAVLATGREVLSLLHGTALTTTQMPALTGDKVAFLADATAVPTTGATSLPAGGSILFSAAGVGIGAKGTGGAETTVAVAGDATSVTRKLAEVKACDTIVTTATTQVSILEIDTTAINGAAVDNCALLVRVRGVGYQNGGTNYSWAFELSAVFSRRTGALALQGSVLSGNSDTDGKWGQGDEPTVLTLDASGNLIRLRVAPFSATSVTWFAVAEVTGVAL